MTRAMIAFAATTVAVGCAASSPETSASSQRSFLENICSDRVIQNECYPETVAGHVRALERADEQLVRVGGPASELRDFLERALVAKPPAGSTELMLYKFPLAAPAGNYVLKDEPRPQYDHYYVVVNARTGMVAEKGFRRYRW